MARTGLAESDVKSAIESLQAAGLPDPSIRMIRQKLGTGSLTTISRYKRSIASDQREAGGSGLPDAVTAHLSTIAEDIWAELSEAADALIARDREAADKAFEASQLEREQSERDRQAADERASALELTLEEERVRIQELESSLDEATANNQQQKIDLARATEKIQGFQALLKAKDHELGQMKKAVQSAQSDVKQSREALTRSNEAHTQHQIQWEKHREALDDELAAVKLQANQQKNDLSAAQLNIKATQTLAEDLKAERNELRAQLKDEQRSLQTQAKKIGKLESAVEAYEEKASLNFAHWQAQINAKDEQIKQLTGNAKRTKKKSGKSSVRR